jgi:uncharacterized protein YndB with AHSA1/START domain
MTTATIPAVRRSVTVSVPVERAFRVFTESFNSWWPGDYHIGRADLAEAVLEQRADGRWYERGVDGTECDWGRVLVWDPPHRLVLTWQINGQWQYDPDPAHASEIELRFTAEGPRQTRVDLEHRLLERLAGGRDLHTALDSPTGWTGVLARFAEAAASAS